MHGFQPLRSHRGLVDGARGGGSTGTLASIYAAGLVDDPVADNTLVGSLAEIYFDTQGKLGITSTSAEDSDRLFYLEHGSNHQTRDYAQEIYNFAPAGNAVTNLAQANPWAFIDRRDLRLTTDVIFQAGYRELACGTAVAQYWFPSQSVAYEIRDIAAIRRDDAGNFSEGWTNQWGVFGHRAYLVEDEGSSIMAAHYTELISLTNALPLNGSGIAWRAVLPNGGFPTTFGELAFIVADNTHFTEDGAAQLWVALNGVRTLVADFNMAGSVVYSDLSTAGNLQVAGTSLFGALATFGDIAVDGDVAIQTGVVSYTYETGLVDGLAAATTTFIMPSRPGKLFYRTGGGYEVVSRTGTVTGGLTYRLTNNGSPTSSTAAISTTVLQSALALPLEVAFGILQIQSLVDMATPTGIEVTIPATGVGLTDLKLIFRITGYFA